MRLAYKTVYRFLFEWGGNNAFVDEIIVGDQARATTDEERETYQHLRDVLSGKVSVEQSGPLRNPLLW